MKQLVLSIIRDGHILLSQKNLSDRVAIYFHELEPENTEAFRDAISYFLANGYRTVSGSQFTNPTVDGKVLYVSFDDNFRNWLVASDILADLGATATFYVNSGVMRGDAASADIASYFERIAYSGPETTLSWDELGELYRAGHTIGCHTHTHPVLSHLNRAQWADEIDHSKKVLEDNLGCKITDFSYPYGMRRHFSDALRDYCAALGFKTIATGISGLQHLDEYDPLSLHRTGWKFDIDLNDNLLNLQVDGKLYARLTGRSAIG